MPAAIRPEEYKEACLRRPQRPNGDEHNIEREKGNSMARTPDQFAPGVSPAGARETETDTEYSGEDPQAPGPDPEPDRVQEPGTAKQEPGGGARTARTQLFHPVAFHRCQYQQEDCHRL